MPGLSARMISSLPHRQQLGWGLYSASFFPEGSAVEPVGWRSFQASVLEAAFLFSWPKLPAPLRVSQALWSTGAGGATSLLSGLHEALTPRPGDGLVFSLMPPK